MRRSSVKGREREREAVRLWVGKLSFFFLMGILFKWSGGSGGYPIKIMKSMASPKPEKKKIIIIINK